MLTTVLWSTAEVLEGFGGICAPIIEGKERKCLSANRSRVYVFFFPSLRWENRVTHRFSFYQRWFDTVFLVSGCVTAVTLLAFHLANRNSDADHHEEDYASNAREAGGRRSKQS